MGKKKCWFTCVKKSEKHRSRKWKWLLHRFRFRHYEVPERTLNEATQEQRKHALATAVATAAAAKAALESANAAAKVVRLTSVPYEIHMEKQFFAAVEIQSAYRGHLARKALSALKGLVRLQAVVRGELVRRRVVKTLTSMSLLLSKSHTKVEHKRVPTQLDYFNQGERRYELSQNERIKSEEGRCNSRRSWDLSSVSKEGMEALYLQKQEAVVKRERMKQYSFSHRERRNDHSMQEPMSHREYRKSSRFDQLTELEALQYQEKDKLIKHFSRSNTIAAKASQLPVAQPRPRTSSCRQEKMDEFNSPFSRPRRSFFHAKEKSSMEDEEDRTLPNSPVFPTYMAATESARAKCRSLSTPKQRLRLCETYWGEHSPYKLGISSWSSFNGDVTKSCGRRNISQNFSFN